MNFIEYVELIEELKKDWNLNEALNLWFKWVNDLKENWNDDWFILFYQISEIYKKSKDFENAIFYFWMMLMYLWRYWWKTHEKNALLLLKKFWKDDISTFLQICIKSENDVELNKNIKEYLS